MGRESRAPAPLAAKGVLRRWNLAESERYVGIPEAVFQAAVSSGLSGTDFFVLVAMLLRWNWRHGVRQTVSIKQLSAVLGYSSRTTTRAALYRLQERGVALVSCGDDNGAKATYVDLAPLRAMAKGIAEGRRSSESAKRSSRNGQRLPPAARKTPSVTRTEDAGGDVRLPDSGMSLDRTASRLSTGQPPVRPPDNYQSIQSIQSLTDAPRRSSTSSSDDPEQRRQAALAYLDRVAVEEAGRKPPTPREVAR